MAWEDVVVALYGSRRLLTPWVPGLKPTEKKPLPLAEAAAALGTQLMLEGMQQVDLCGVGLGAMVAAQLAADQPDRVRRLVLVGGQVRPSRSALRVQSGLMRLVPASRLADAGVSKSRLLEALDVARELDLTDALPRIAAPTLAVVGSRDRFGQVGARALVNGIRDARLRVVDGAGAAVNVEASAELVTVLRDFLD
jgi:pimeloyl-ACP methyl ester carboxylesterase